MENLQELKKAELKEIGGGDWITRSIFSFLGTAAAILSNLDKHESQHGVHIH